jgi:hypothetical protein
MMPLYLYFLTFIFKYKAIEHYFYEKLTNCYLYEIIKINERFSLTKNLKTPLFLKTLLHFSC